MQRNFIKRKKTISIILIIILFNLNLIASQFTVKADRIITDRKNGTVKLFGNCLVKSKEFSIRADNITIDKKNGVVIAKGNVVIRKGDIKGKGKTLLYHKASGNITILKGEIILEGTYRFIARNITFLPDNVYSMENCTFTTCPEGCNYWGFFSKKVRVKKEGYATFKSLKFRVNRKTAFYLPFFVYPAKTRRTFGLLIPELGNSSKHGFNYKQELFIPIGQSQDITLGVDYYSKAGTGLTFEYRESFKKGEYGRFKIYSIKDKLINNRRTMGEFQYSYEPSPDETISFKGFLGDDYSLVRDYTFGKYDLAMRDFYTYGGYYRKLGKHFAITTSIYLEKPILKKTVLYSSTMPALSIYGDRFKISGRNIKFKLKASLISDDRVKNATYSRYSLNILSTKDIVLSQLTIEEKLKIKTLNYSIEKMEQNTSIDYSYTLKFPMLYKKYNHFKNTIQPFIQAGYRDNSDGPTFLFHSIEDYFDPSGFYIKGGLYSNFLFKNKTGTVALFGEKNISSKRYIDPYNPVLSSEFTEIRAIVFFPVTKEISISSTIKYNPKTNRFDTLSFNTSLYNLYLTYYRGFVYGEEKTRNSLIGRYRLRLSSNWRAIAQFDYDFSLNDFRYKRITFAYYKRCIGVNITYQNNAYSTITTNQFTISLVLRSIGELFKYRLGL